MLSLRLSPLAWTLFRLCFSGQASAHFPGASPCLCLYASLPRDLPVLARAHRLAEEAWQALKTGDREWRALIDSLDFDALTERLMVTAEEAA